MLTLFWSFTKSRNTKVTYNAENRPIRWVQGETVIEMAFDRLGRRVWMRESEGDAVTKEERFVYDGYLCVQRLDAMQENAVWTEFVWDPTEPVATRPLAMRAKNWGLNLFYSHDGNKNVSEVFYHAPQNGIAAHYDYAPFGAITRTSSATRVTNRDILSENPFRFSSEHYDDTLSLVYYNYRHYNPLAGRWLGRDWYFFVNAYLFCDNASLFAYDILGLAKVEITTRKGSAPSRASLNTTFYYVDVKIVEPPADGCFITFIQHYTNDASPSGVIDVPLDGKGKGREPYYYLRDSIVALDSYNPVRGRGKLKAGDVITFADGPMGIPTTTFTLYVVEVCRECKIDSLCSRVCKLTDTITVLARLDYEFNNQSSEQTGYQSTDPPEMTKFLQQYLSAPGYSAFWNAPIEFRLKVRKGK